MDSNHTDSTAQSYQREVSTLVISRKRSEGVKKRRLQAPVRKSARTRKRHQIHERSGPKDDHIHGRQTLSPPSISHNLTYRRTSQGPLPLQEPPIPTRKRKRPEAPDHRIQERPLPEQSQSPYTSRLAEETINLDAVKKLADSTFDPVKYWVLTETWPKTYLEQDSQVREDLKHDSCLEEQMEESSQVIQYVEINGYRYPCPIRKVPTSLRRKQSDSSFIGSGDDKKRESKSAPYRDTRYTTLLAAKGSHLREFDVYDIPNKTKDLCRKLLEADQAVPLDSSFRENILFKTSRVIQDISRLIVPSAEILATYGATNLDHLIEGVNEGWTGGIPVQGPRPQPDYSVGFRRSSFAAEQLDKLDPFIGSVFDTSFFVATYTMYFPFLMCEVKCGAAALDVADRQNAHSMTLAVRGVVELFKLVKREKELHHEILAFSVSHDDRTMRIYGHYALIEEGKTSFYRHPIHDYGFAALEGKDKWTAYKFTKNVYNTWMPAHLRRICSAIDEIPPDVIFDVSDQAAFPATQDSQQSNAESLSFLGDDESIAGSQEKNSSAQGPERQIKMSKNRRAAG
ncbi:hypothetical protein MMC25_004288 [Agyrium rufum]|nr:hypothetical protein [Agyrium rufum]